MRIDPERLLAAYEIAAQIVDRYGERFLPIFLLVEEEVEAMEGRNSAVARARALASRRAA